MVRLYVIVGGLLLLLVVAAFVGPRFVDWTQYRERFEAEATRLLGHDVSVRGDASARLLPFPSIVFEDVTIGGADEAVSASVERFAMDLELAPFLRGELLIFDMRLTAPDIRLMPDAEGRYVPERRGEPIRPDAVSIESLTVTDGRLAIEDRSTGRERLFTGIDLDLAAETLTGPWRAAGALTTDGTRLEIEAQTGLYEPALRPGVRLRAEIDGEAFPAPLDLTGTLTLVEGRPRYDGEFSAAAGGDVPFQLTGAFAATPSGAEVPEYRMAVGERDDPYVVTGRATFDLGRSPRFELAARGQRLDASALGGQIGAGVPLVERIAFVEELVAALPRPTMPGRVDVDLPALVLGDTTFREVALDATSANGEWRIDRLATDMPGRTSLVLEGRASAEEGFVFEGEVALLSRQPTGLASWLGGTVTEPLRTLDRLGLEGRLVIDSAGQRLDDLTVLLGSQRLTGTVSRRNEPGGDPPVRVELSGAQLDLDAARAVAAAMFDGRGEDAALKLAVGEIALEGIRAREVTFEGTLGGSAVAIDQLGFSRLAGSDGSVVGQLGLDGTIASELTVTVAADDPTALLELLDARLDTEWTGGLAARAEGFGALNATAELAWLEPGAPIGFEARGSLGATVWSAGGTFDASDVDGRLLPVAEIGSGTFELKDRGLGSLMRQAGFDVRAGGDQDEVTVAIEYERSQTARRADIRLSRAVDDVRLTLLEQGEEILADLRFDVGSLRPYLALAGVDAAGLENLAAEGTGTASGSGGLWKAELGEIQVGSTILSGAVTGSDGRWQGDLETGHLPIDALLALALGVDTLPEAFSAEGPFAEPRLPRADVLLEFDARTASLAPGLLARQASGQLRVTPDGVAVQKLEGIVSGGALTGRLAVRNAQGVALANAALDLDSATFADLPLAGGLPLDEGTASIQGALETTGETWPDFLSSITGGGTARIDDPAVPGLDPLALTRIYRTFDGSDAEIGTDTVAEAVAAELPAAPLRPRRLLLSWSLTGPLLRLDLAPTVDAGTRLGGRGEIDLADQQVDATATLSFAVPDDRGEGSDPSVTLAFSGPLDAPERRIDAQALTGFLNLRAFEIERDRVAALRAALVETQRLRRETLLYDRGSRRTEDVREEAVVEPGG